MFNIIPIKNKIIEKIISPGVSGFIWIQRNENIKNYPLNVNDHNCDQKRLTCMPNVYQIEYERIKKFEIFKDDIWIITYPKCGTTWTQEMIWLIANNLDFDTANNIDITDRSPFFEFNGVTPNLSVDFFKLTENLKRPRIIKTHLPSVLLPDDIWVKKPKMIYVARNPKDVIVSFFHHFQHLVGYKGNLNDFAEAFLTHQLSYCPYPEHIMDFWKMRNEENILFITYENMKKDLKDIIQKSCKFLNKTSYTKEQIDQLAEHLNFDQMKKNPKCNNEMLVHYAKESLGEMKNDKTDDKNFHFMRKGQVGTYKNELTDEYIKRIDEWSSKYMNYDGFKFDENHL